MKLLRELLRWFKMMSREEALKLVKERVSRSSLYRHMLATEAIMRELARKLGENEEIWGLTGLLHDIDFEETESQPEKHGLLAEEVLKGKVPEEVVRAIKAHNFERTGVKPVSKLEKALIACDAVTGLVIACALVMPSKKLCDVKLKTLRKKFKEKSFAPGSNREKIRFCEEIGVPLNEFLELSLEALKKIAGELGG